MEIDCSLPCLQAPATYS